MKNCRPRILFVCYANSAHALPWINLLDHSEFDIRVFSTSLRDIPYNVKPWPYPTYLVVKPEPSNYSRNKIVSLLPGKPIRSLSNYLECRFALSVHMLRFVINLWKPAIIHSMPLDVGGKLTQKALSNIPKNSRPKWIASSWGSDIYVGYQKSHLKGNIQHILSNVDGFFADCQRDINYAIQIGLDQQKLAFTYPIPGQGGLDLTQFEQLRKINYSRNIILIPKAFERFTANRTMPILEALNLLGTKTKDYEIHLLGCSKDVLWYLNNISDEVRNRCHCHSMFNEKDIISQKSIFELMARARIVIAPSLSDGTPNVMLEAMAAGALPIMSPIESHQEWIVHGENGLLAHALYPNQIAIMIQRALHDHILFEKAYKQNWEIVSLRADRTKIRKQVLSYYQSLLH